MSIPNATVSELCPSYTLDLVFFIKFQRLINVWPHTQTHVFQTLAMIDLPIIQKTYDLIKWYVPILNRLPRSHKFLLGDRMVVGLYTFLENLLRARYERHKLPRLEALNSELDVLRYQTRLLKDFDLVSVKRYEYVSGMINDIGSDLGGWIKQQKYRDTQGRNSRKSSVYATPGS